MPRHMSIEAARVNASSVAVARPEWQSRCVGWRMR